MMSNYFYVTLVFPNNKLSVRFGDVNTDNKITL
jgi:hypothetical protein